MRERRSLLWDAAKVQGCVRRERKGQLRLYKRLLGLRPGRTLEHEDHCAGLEVENFPGLLHCSRITGAISRQRTRSFRRARPLSTTPPRPPLSGSGKRQHLAEFSPAARAARTIGILVTISTANEKGKEAAEGSHTDRIKIEK
ncbi:uncharacterized protein PS065_013992 [Dugong dugon]